MRPLRLIPPLALTAIATPALAAEEDGNAWLAQYVTLDTGDKVFLRFEAQERFTNDSRRLGQLLLRSLVAVRVAKGAHVGVGYAYVLTDPVGPPRFDEHRFYEEVGVRLLSTESGITLDSRTRLEQRTFAQRAGTDWRLREWLQLRVPVSENSKLSFYTEPFFDLSEGPVQRGGLSVWRNFAGVAVRLADGIEVVPGYLNQRVFRDGEDRIDHTANVSLFLTF